MNSDQPITIWSFCPIADLMAIAEWLSLNDHDEFMNVYAAVRGSIMKKSLDQVSKS